MKIFFRNIGLITIICISFLISEKTSLVVKDVDTDLIELKEQEKEYYIEPQNATIKNNTIIPGIEGKRLNIDKTYKQIKKKGQISEKDYVYDTIEPEISLKNTYNKYIIKGNPKNKKVSILFVIKQGDNITKIIEILEQHRIKADLFIEEKWMEENQSKLEELKKKGYIIQELETTQGTTNIKIKNLVKNQKQQKYCYIEQENEQKLRECMKQKKHTIKTEKIHSTEPLMDIKKKIENGKIIALAINKTTTDELNIIIKYIKSKGYKIENLSNLLSEKNNN